MLATLRSLGLHLFLFGRKGCRSLKRGQPGLAGRVAEVVYLGELTARRVTLDCGKELWMRSMSASPADVGDRIEVRWRNADARVLSS
jgi:ABC-type Fe3+/spermidine/putrescine transport system ATPase subunit